MSLSRVRSLTEVRERLGTSTADGNEAVVDIEAEDNASSEHYLMLGDKRTEGSSKESERELQFGTKERIKETELQLGSEEESKETAGNSTEKQENDKMENKMVKESGNSSIGKVSLSEELLKLSKYGWYWGPISGDVADTKLISEPDGAFLVRDSSDDRYSENLFFIIFTTRDM